MNILELHKIWKNGGTKFEIKIKFKFYKIEWQNFKQQKLTKRIITQKIWTLDVVISTRLDTKVETQILKQQQQRCQKN